MNYNFLTFSFFRYGVEFHHSIRNSSKNSARSFFLRMKLLLTWSWWLQCHRIKKDESSSPLKKKKGRWTLSRELIDLAVEPRRTEARTCREIGLASSPLPSVICSAGFRRTLRGRRRSGCWWGVFTLFHNENIGVGVCALVVALGLAIWPFHFFVQFRTIFCIWQSQ